MYTPFQLSGVITLFKIAEPTISINVMNKCFIKWAVNGRILSQFVGKKELFTMRII